MEEEILPELIEYLQKVSGEVEVIDHEEEVLIEVTKSDWFRNIREEMISGDNMRTYREMHTLSQEELGQRLDSFSRQNISNMERGHRSISKATAKKLLNSSI